MGSAILHMLWNINGLLNITTQDDHWGIYQYIRYKNVLLQVETMVWIHHYFQYVVILQLL